jgi:hypothetical protein
MEHARADRERPADPRLDAGARRRARRDEHGASLAGLSSARSHAPDCRCLGARRAPAAPSTRREHRTAGFQRWAAPDLGRQGRARRAPTQLAHALRPRSGSRPRCLVAHRGGGIRGWRLHAGATLAQPTRRRGRADDRQPPQLRARRVRVCAEAGLVHVESDGGDGPPGDRAGGPGHPLPRLERARRAAARRGGAASAPGRARSSQMRVRRPTMRCISRRR